MGKDHNKVRESATLTKERQVDRVPPISEPATEEVLSGVPVRSSLG
jgi:hypothetical protein